MAESGVSPMVAYDPLLPVDDVIMEDSSPAQSGPCQF
jgi:hypothetical protein